ALTESLTIMKMLVLGIISILFLGISYSQEISTSQWHGFEKKSFSFDGRTAYIVKPSTALAGNPWIWRAYFPDWHYEMDSILVSKGFHIAFIDCSDMFGNAESMRIWENFYLHLTDAYSFSKKPVLEGVSRGGLYIYGWAKRNPDKVSFIYAEAPVLDIRSWPGGKGTGRGSADDWKKCLTAIKITEAEASNFRDNPIDNIESIAAYKIPTVHVVCMQDSIVPVAENTAIMEKRLLQAGGRIIIDNMTEDISLEGHHFKITDPNQYAEMIMNKTIPVSKFISSGSFIELNGKLNNTISKLRNRKSLTVAFLGGSITYNTGWRTKLTQYLQETYPATQFNFIAAGIPSLGSLPHSFRLQTDVLDKGVIDLLFIEAAVNDHANKTTEEIQRRSMEGIIRHALVANPTMNIVLMAFADEDKNSEYKKNQEPIEVKVHRQLAKHYGLPFINLAKEVYERISRGEFTWKDDFKDLHPSPYGQNLYFQSIKKMLQLSDHSYRREGTVGIKRPVTLDKRSYDKGEYVNVKRATNLNGFSIIEEWSPADDKETREGFVRVPVLQATEAGSSFRLTFTGNAVGIAILSGPDAGVIEYSIDDRKTKNLSLFTEWSNYLHLPWYLILGDGLKSGKHILEVKILPAGRNSAGKACRIVHFLINK
ncbi:MAG: GDSL-type esterase/lipase family protein, partial [Chitinophagaceae bacterium]